MDAYLEKIEEQQRIINELTAHVAQYEIISRELMQTQNSLDNQIITYGLIHKYAQMAFLYEEEDLHNIIAEGIVDIFQLEIAGVYDIDLEKNVLVSLGSCNMPEGTEEIPLVETEETKKWIASWEEFEDSFSYESPVKNPLWECLDCSTVVTYVFVDNDKMPIGVVVGGISKSSEAFYDFSLKLSKSSFLVYCQQMNSLCMNFDAITQIRHAGEAKSHFLANLSHEIRTPMNAILGMTTIAEKSNSKKEILNCLSKIDGSSHHLLRLINDILDMSKIEEGKMILNKNSFKLTEVIDQLLSSITPLIESKKQNLKINMSSVRKNDFFGDPLRLSQVIINILSNAMKFTPEGGTITLDIADGGENSNKTKLIFTVTDTGIGIEADKLDSIFRPFEQADGSISRQYGGTGLGLAISQKIVELMDGLIHVESEVGKGTTFSFFVWIENDKDSVNADLELIEKQERSDVPTDTDLSGEKILIVDDVDINREIVRAFLSETKADLTEAENGQQAIDIFQKSKPDEYSLILMDVQMPVMDGRSATKIIRGLDRSDSGTIPIYAMTADVFKEDINKVLEAGMNGHISKPVDCDVMIKIVVDAVKNGK